VAFSNYNSFLVPEFFVGEFSWKLWAFQNQGIAVNISVECDIGGSLVELEVVSCQIVIFILIKIWEREFVDKRDQAVEVSVFGLGENADIEWCFERRFGICETKYYLGAGDCEGRKFVVHKILL